MSLSNLSPTPIAKNNSKSTTNKPVSPITIVNRNKVVKNNEQISDTEKVSADDWTVIPTVHNKRPLTSPGGSPKSKQPNDNPFKSVNRYSALQNDNELDMETTDTIIPTIHRPPPIFIKTEIDYQKFCTAIKLLIDSTEFTCKSNTSSLKLQLNSPDDFRKVVKMLKSKNIDFHTYQIKQEKSFRVILKNLHHSTPIDFITEEIEHLGYKVNQVVNVLQRLTKKPLPVFFIDLEPNICYSEIFKVKSICHSMIKFEEPRPNKQAIQCHCHTRSYCNHQPRCVKCDGLHSTSECQKPKEDPPKCTLCGGPHPANYRGCPIFKDLQQKKMTHSKNTTKTFYNPNSNVSNVNTNVQAPIGITPNQIPPNPTHNPTYATITSQTTPINHSQVNDAHVNNTTSDALSQHLTSFILDLKSLINPLIFLLTTVINKILLKND